MTSDEIKNKYPGRNDAWEPLAVEWLREIAYQLALMNERHKEALGFAEQTLKGMRTPSPFPADSPVIPPSMLPTRRNQMPRSKRNPRKVRRFGPKKGL